MDMVSKLREISWHDECMRMGSLVRFRRSARPMAAVAAARRSCDETMTERPSPAVSTSKSACAAGSRHGLRRKAWSEWHCSKPRSERGESRKHESSKGMRYSS